VEFDRVSTRVAVFAAEQVMALPCQQSETVSAFAWNADHPVVAGLN